MKTSEDNHLELPLAAPDPPEQEDEGHGEEQAQTDQAQRHDGVTADATFLKYNRIENEEINHLITSACPWRWPMSP